MKDDILDKLRRFLEKEPPFVRSEPDAMWVLVEIRKIIDAETDPNTYLSLKVYCDWTAHTALTKATRIGPIMKMVDDDIFNCMHPDGHGSSPEEHEKLEALLYLDAFRKDLSAFLHDYNLPPTLADNDAEWFTFLKYYSAVIEDCSLKPRNAGDLRMIREITFRKETNGVKESEGIPFDILWDIHLKDGQELTWVLNSTGKLLGTFLYGKNEAPIVSEPAPKRRIPWLEG